MKQLLLVCAVGVALFALAHAQENEAICNQRTNCDDCLEGFSNDTVSFDCYWCKKPTNSSGFKCRHFTFNTAVPVDGVECQNLELNVATCRLTVVVIIVLIVLACLVVVIALCCVCCFCCFYCAKRRQRQRMEEEERYLDEKENIRQRSSDRRAERKQRQDEIKKKYGLNTDEGAGTYKRLD